MSSALLSFRITPIVFFIMLQGQAFSQMLPASQIIDNFDDNVVTNWSVPTAACVNTYTLSESNAEFKVDFSINQPECYDRFYYTLPSVTNFTTTPILCLKLKSETSTFIKLQIELEDVFGTKTNSTPFIINNPTLVPIDGNNPNGQYFEYCFDFSGDWNQSWPAAATVDKTQIKKIVFYVNGNNPPAGFYTGGTLWFDDIVRRSNNPVPAAGGTFYSNGSAVNNSSSPTTHIYRLTDDNGLFQASTVFNKTPHNWTTDFDGYFNVFVGCFDAPGADGISFMLMNDPSKLNKTGGGGGGFGYGQGQRTYIEFPKSMAVEFDTWDNTVDGMTNDVAGATSDDHIAVDLNGHENTMVAGSRVNMGNLEDNTIHLLRVQYTASTTTLRIYWDGVLRLTQSINIANYFNTGAAPLSTTAYWGFTGSTGGSKNEQWFSYNATSTPPTYTTLCNVALPVQLISFTGSRQANKVVLDWSTSSEYRNDYFEVEKSFNGSEWKSIGTVAGKGTFAGISDYALDDVNLLGPVNYYRLKQVDQDGVVHYSSIVAIENTSVSLFEVYPNPAREILKIHVPGSGYAELTISDLAGNSIYHSGISAGENSTINVGSFASGFYIIKVNTGGNEYHEKVLIAD